MKIKLFSLLCLLLISVSCEKSVTLDDVSDMRIAPRSVNNDYSFFKDVEGIGTSHLSGYLYCSKPSTYTIMFSYSGDAGVIYEAGIGDNIRVYPTNGESLRTITVTLQPGKHRCFVDLSFQQGGLCGTALFNIRAVNGDLLAGTEGYGDLVASGCSEMQGSGGSQAVHWVCSKCNMINSNAISNCLSCGSSKY